MPGWHIQIRANRSPFFYVYYVWTRQRVWYTMHAYITSQHYQDTDETYV